MTGSPLPLGATVVLCGSLLALGIATIIRGNELLTPKITDASEDRPSSPDGLTWELTELSSTDMSISEVVSSREIWVCSY